MMSTLDNIKAGGASDMQSKATGDEDDAAWRSDLGIPQTHEPVIQKYFETRDTLIDQEDRQRSGSCTYVDMTLWAGI